MKIYRILAVAYDVNPYKGSESGTGWNFILQLSQYFEVVAITRNNNRDYIERYVKENNISTKKLKFVYFDLPYYLRFWKRGGRGAFLYYNIWTLLIPLHVLIRGIKYDAAQHINFHADHVAPFLWVLRRPLIWGPINHNEPIPFAFCGSFFDFCHDRLKFLVKWLRWHFDPLLRLCLARSFAVIGSNSSVCRRLGVPPAKYFNLSTIGARSNNHCRDESSTSFTVLCVGRFVAIKSFDVAIKSFALFRASLPAAVQRNAELILVGSGPKLRELEILIARCGVAQSVKIIGWITQSELFDYYNKSSLLLVTSHEGGGAVVAEAMSFGLPVVTVDNSGSTNTVDSSCGSVIARSGYADTCVAIADELIRLFADRELLRSKSKGATIRFNDQLSWDSKGANLLEIYRSIFNQ